MTVRVRDAVLRPWQVGEVHALSPPLMILVTSPSGATRKDYRYIERVPEDATIYEIKEKCEMDLREELDEEEGRFGTAGRSRTPSERFERDRTPSPEPPTVFYIGSSGGGSATPPMAQPDPQPNLSPTPPPQDSDVVSDEANEMAKALLEFRASIGGFFHSVGREGLPADAVVYTEPSSGQVYGELATQDPDVSRQITPSATISLLPRDHSEEYTLLSLRRRTRESGNHVSPAQARGGTRSSGREVQGRG